MKTEPVGPDRNLILQVTCMQHPVYQIVMRGTHIYRHDSTSWYRTVDGVFHTPGITPVERFALQLAAKGSQYYLEWVARHVVTRVCRATHDQWLAEVDKSMWIGPDDDNSMP